MVQMKTLESPTTFIKRCANLTIIIGPDQGLKGKFFAPHLNGLIS